MSKSIEIPEQIKQLISGQLSGSLSADELRLLQAWIDESPDHRKHFNDMRHVWAFSDNTLSNREQGESVWNLSKKIQRDRARHPAFWTWQKMVASWIVVFAGTWMLNMLMDRGEVKETIVKTAPPVTSTTTIQAKMGSQTSVKMPDGSRVWLNGGSKLVYCSSYGEDDREVQLTGEGCFEVATHPEKPFVVKAGDLSIIALGTTFNVKAYPEDKVITTTLVEGKVTIEGKDANDETFTYEMHPNENFTYITGGRATEKESLQPVRKQATAIKNNVQEPVLIENNVKVRLYTSWKDDQWEIENQELGNLSKDFERRYNVRIVFASKNIADYHFTGIIQRETIEQVMVILRRTVPLKYSFDKNVITIAEDPVLMKEFHLKNK